VPAALRQEWARPAWVSDSVLEAFPGHRPGGSQAREDLATVTATPVTRATAGETPAGQVPAPGMADQTAERERAQATAVEDLVATVAVAEEEAAAAEEAAAEEAAAVAVVEAAEPAVADRCLSGNFLNTRCERRARARR
jgi:hypothetical protein